MVTINKKFTTLLDFFQKLNEIEIKYVILRNWESIDVMSDHIPCEGDIDILVSDVEEFIDFSGAQKAHYHESDRSNYFVHVGNSLIKLDIRYIGDGYYDSGLEKLILEKRQQLSAFYVVDDGNYPYILAYHALVHKKKLNERYVTMLGELFGIDSSIEQLIVSNIKNYLYSNGWSVPVPRDKGVYFNIVNAMKIGKIDRYERIPGHCFFLLQCKLKSIL